MFMVVAIYRGFLIEELILCAIKEIGFMMFLGYI